MNLPSKYWNFEKKTLELKWVASIPSHLYIINLVRLVQGLKIGSARNLGTRPATLNVSAAKLITGERVLHGCMYVYSLPDNTNPV